MKAKESVLPEVSKSLDVEMVGVIVNKEGLMSWGLYYIAIDFHRFFKVVLNNLNALVTSLEVEQVPLRTDHVRLWHHVLECSVDLNGASVKLNDLDAATFDHFSRVKVSSLRNVDGLIVYFIYNFRVSESYECPTIEHLLDLAVVECFGVLEDVAVRPCAVHVRFINQGFLPGHLFNDGVDIVLGQVLVVLEVLGDFEWLHPLSGIDAP